MIFNKSKVSLFPYTSTALTYSATVRAEEPRNISTAARPVRCRPFDTTFYYLSNITPLQL